MQTVINISKLSETCEFLNRHLKQQTGKGEPGHISSHELSKALEAITVPEDERVLFTGLDVATMAEEQEVQISDQQACELISDWKETLEADLCSTMSDAIYEVVL